MDSEIIINGIPNYEDLEIDSDKHFINIKIKLKFLRIKPIVTEIEKEVPINFMFNEFDKIFDEYKNNGIAMKINDNNLIIIDYFKFLKTLFRNQNVKIEDTQYHNEKGYPDFKLTDQDDKIFYIEVKKGSSSGISADQLSWMAKNSGSVWYMIIENFGGNHQSKILDDFDWWLRTRQNR